MTSSTDGQWETLADGAVVWRRDDGSLWRQTPDGGWEVAPESTRPARADPGVPQASPRMFPVRWAALLGLVAAAVGVLLPWASVAVISVSGVDTSDGKLYGAVVLAALALFAVRIARPQRIWAVLLVLALLALAGLASFEIVHLSTTESGGSALSLHVGAGLYLDVIGPVIAFVAVGAELITCWAEPLGRRPVARRTVAVLAGSAVVVSGTGIGAGIGFTKPPAEHPEATVQRYLSALAQGDATAALAAGTSAGATTFLTNDVLSRQQKLAPLAHIKLGAVERTSDQASVEATYDVGAKPVEATFDLHKRNGRWLLDETTVQVTLGLSAPPPGLLLFGVPVTESTARVFPGPLQFATSDPNLAVSERATEWATSPGEESYADLTLELSAAGRQRVMDALNAKVAACAKATTLEPSGCPQSTFAFGDLVPGSVAWIASSPTGVQLYLTSSSAASVDVNAEVRWTVTYQYKDFDNSVRSEKKSVASYVSGTVDLTATAPVLNLRN